MAEFSAVLPFQRLWMICSRWLRPVPASTGVESPGSTAVARDICDRCGTAASTSPVEVSLILKVVGMTTTLPDHVSSQAPAHHWPRLGVLRAQCA